MDIVNSTLPVYNIRNWGRAGWQFLQAIAFTYPQTPTDDDVCTMRKFLVQTGKVLPCRTCRYHFGVAIKNMSDESLSSRQGLLHWMFDVQNDIRKRQNRPPLSYSDRYSECVNGYTGNPIITCTWKQTTCVLALVTVILIAYIVYSRKL